MTPEIRPTLSYEDTLGALLGFMGRPVIVIVSGAGGEPPEAMAVLFGTLTRADRSPAFDLLHWAQGDDPREALTFQVGPAAGGAGTGAPLEGGYFTLTKRDFVRATWMRQELLFVELGRCQFSITPQLPPAA